MSLELDKLKFEPTKTAKKWWKWTRKDEFSYAGITLPGLFQIHNFAVDAPVFVGVIVLEGFGLFNIVSSVGGLYSFILAFLAFMVDLFLAITHHATGQGDKCYYENKLVIVDLLAKEKCMGTESDADTKAAVVNATADQLRSSYKDKLRKLRIKSHVIAFFIWVAAIIKVLSFLILQGMNIDALSVSVVLTYLLSAYLHIYYTGYFIFGFICWYYMDRDVKRYSDGQIPILNPKDRNNQYQRTIITNASIPLSLEFQNHKIKFIPAEKYDVLKNEGHLSQDQLNELADRNKKLYIFTSCGILSDKALQSLANGAGNTDAQREIVLYGLSIQLQILEN